MEAPRIGLSLADLNAALKAHCQQMYEDITNDGLHCKGCGEKVEFVPCTVSIHYAAPDGACTDSGDVQHFPLPYCPKCEGEPTPKSTCVHMGAPPPGKFFGGLLESADRLELI